jgi:hypothetical protein
MNGFELPTATTPAHSTLERPVAKRRLDPIDKPARPLGTKRAALQRQRVTTSTRPARQRRCGTEPGISLLASHDDKVTFLLRSTTFGLLMERTQRQIHGVCLVQAMVFPDAESFDRWCGCEPLRFEDGLLFNKLVREGHAALAHIR